MLSKLQKITKQQRSNHESTQNTQTNKQINKNNKIKYTFQNKPTNIHTHTLTKLETNHAFYPSKINSSYAPHHPPPTPL